MNGDGNQGLAFIKLTVSTFKSIDARRLGYPVTADEVIRNGVLFDNIVEDAIDRQACRAMASFRGAQSAAGSRHIGSRDRANRKQN